MIVNTYFPLVLIYSKTCVKRPLSKRPDIGFQDHLSPNAGQKYCRMLQREHSVIFSTLIKLPLVIKIFVLSIFEWPLQTDFTVCFGPQKNRFIETVLLSTKAYALNEKSE